MNTKNSPEYKCQYCNKEFIRETSFLNHKCEKMKRYEVRNENYSKIAQEAYIAMFPNNSQYKKCRTFEHFISSHFYKSLIEFGKFVVNSEIISPKKYMKFLNEHNVNVKNWTDYRIYSQFLKHMFSTETPEDALIRSLEFIEKWSSDNNCEFYEFFSKIHPVEAVVHIKSGRLSPWLILPDGIGDKLFDRMLDEQLIEISDIIDPVYWNIKFKRHLYKIQATLSHIKRLSK